MVTKRIVEAQDAVRRHRELVSSLRSSDLPEVSFGSLENAVGQLGN